MNTAELYEHWMEVETSYALDKLSAADHYPYWEEGVTRGDFSCMVGAMNYVQRARLFAGQLEGSHDPLGLQVVQSLGKAAHNLVTLDATAKSYTTDKKSYLSNLVDTVNVLAYDVEVPNPFDYMDVVAIQKSQDFRSEVFRELQDLQDANDIEQFQACLQPELLFAARQFVAAAEIYGWTTPGMTSGKIQRWNLADV